jgi:hypothetical protein
MSVRIGDIARVGLEVINEAGSLSGGAPQLLGRFSAGPVETFARAASLAEGYAARAGIDLLKINGLRTGRPISGPLVERAGAPPDKQYDGFYVGADRKAYPPSTPLDDVLPVLPRSGRATGERIIFVNGVGNAKDTQAAALQEIADRTGAPVIGVHNATEGFFADIGQSLQDKLDKGTNPAVDTLANTIYNEIRAGRTVHIMAHSQGGIIASRALTDAYQRLRLEDGLSRSQAERLLGQVRVETFGAAAGSYPDGPQYVHYINRADIVPTWFGLGIDVDRFNPTLHPGRGAVVYRFTDFDLFDPFGGHSFVDTYLPRRVPFEQARRGDF